MKTERTIDEAFDSLTEAGCIAEAITEALFNDALDNESAKFAVKGLTRLIQDTTWELSELFDKAMKNKPKAAEPPAPKKRKKAA